MLGSTSPGTKLSLSLYKRLRLTGGEGEGGMLENRSTNLCGVNFSLYDVEDGDIAVIRLTMDRRGHHHVLWL